MTLGLYGDSYGVKNSNSHKLWADILVEKLDTTYTNYSKNASSLFYSYNQFIKTNAKYDIVIFLVTLPYRYTKSIVLEATGDKEHHISGTHNIDQWFRLNKELTNADCELLNSLRSWFWLMDDKFYELAQRFIVEDIVVQRPDVVIMPCFEQSLTAEQYNKFGLTRNEHFYRLNELQCRSFGMPVEQCIRYRENTEIMNGHLTPEFNEIVGNLVYNRIVNNKWTRFPTETIKHKFTMKEYYKNYE
jgi:hypothetical protein